MKKPELHKPDGETDDPRGIRPLQRLSTMVALAVMTVGLYDMVTETYYGYTPCYGGSEVVLLDEEAFRADAMLFMLGLMPLGVWFSKPWKVVLWMGL